MEKWFEELFIDEVKPALDRHSGTGGGNSDCDGDCLTNAEGVEF